MAESEPPPRDSDDALRSMAPGMALEKAARIAAKRNERARQAMPLFADQLDQITDEQVKAAFDRREAHMIACRKRLQAYGDECRAKVRSLASADAFAALETRRALLPASEEYHADFWRRELEKIHESC